MEYLSTIISIWQVVAGYLPAIDYGFWGPVFLVGYAVGGIVGAIVLQYHFAALMNFRYAQKKMGDEYPDINIVLQAPQFLAGYSWDIFYSCVWGYAVFWCLPKFKKRSFEGSVWNRIKTAASYIGDLTLTNTLNRMYVPGDTGYRSRLAGWLGKTLVNPHDFTEEHVEMDK